MISVHRRSPSSSSRVPLPKVATAILGLALGLVLSILPLGGILTSTASAAPGDIGYRGPSAAGDGSAATGEKPQSKLWWHDGSWWAVLWDTASSTHRIFKLNRSTQQWVNTGTQVDPRAKTRSDVLWDGTHLYVASHERADSSSQNVANKPARLYRFSYNSSTRKYQLNSGFPVTIENYSVETLTIEKDSAGVLWATWTQNKTVYVNSTNGNDTAWGTPFPLPVSGASGLDPDDISAVVSFKNRIGVMWSNQVTSAVYFAIHNSGAAPTTWQTRSIALQGPNSADDHINIKSLQADPSGRVFAVVKTGLDDDPGSPQSAPQIVVLARDPSTGSWSHATFGRIQDCHTRPVLILDSQNQMVYVFATAPDSGCPYSGYPGTIFMKSSPMASLSFPTGRGTPVIKDASSPNLNNVTSTKQTVNSTTGLVVMASNDETRYYWHADVPLVTP